MLKPPDFSLNASKALIAEAMSLFFPNSSIIKQNRSWECGKILAYLNS